MSDSGSGKRGFVRDVMKRIASPGSREEDGPGGGRAGDEQDEIESLREALQR